jgi:hypothetical protein
MASPITLRVAVDRLRIDPEVVQLLTEGDPTTSAAAAEQFVVK